MARPRKDPADPKWQAQDELPTLQTYIAQREAQRLDEGVVLVRVTYPGASQHFDGTYSGITVTDGPLGCVWSDGRAD